MAHLIRRPGRGLGASWPALMAALAVAVLLSIHQTGAALARDVAIVGSQVDRFGRIALQFDEPTKVQVRSTAGVVVISFAEPARIRSEKLTTEMGRYVTTVRRDPDNTGLRLALTAPVRTNILEAGERVFIDLLPANWTGLLPGLPPEVVAELAERVRVAEDKLKREALRPPPPAAPVKLRVSQLPTLTRLVFAPPAGAPVRLKDGNGAVEVAVDVATRLDDGGDKPRLAPGIRTFEVVKGESSLTIRIAAAPGYQAHGFREDDTVVVDLAKPAPASPAAAAATDPRPSPSSNPKPAAVQAGPAPLPAAAVRSEPSAGTEEKSPTSAAPAQTAVAVPAAAAPVVAGSAMVLVPRIEADAARSALVLPFRTRTAAAAYVRDGLLTLVFATRDSVDPARLAGQVAGFMTLRDCGTREGFLVMRFASVRAGPVRLLADGTEWRLSLGDGAALAPDAVKVSRTLDENGHGVVTVALAAASEAHWMTEPDGSRMAVVTAFGRPQGLPLARTFVEFGLPATLHGVLVEARADDLTVGLGQGGVVVTRDAGLSLSPMGRLRADGSQATQLSGLVIARDAWIADGSGDVLGRYHDLIAAAANASRSGRAEARYRLARFLLANGMSLEAGSVIALARAEDPLFARRRETVLLAAIAAARSGRYAAARVALSAEGLADDPEAILWRAVVDAGDRRWPHAMAGFRRSSDVVELYPDDMSGMIHLAMLRTAIEQGDIPKAEGELAAIDRLSTASVAPDEHDLARAILDEAAGRTEGALKGYERLIESGGERAGSEALLRSVSLAYRKETIGLDAAIDRLEGLLVTWHGGDIEIGTVAALARLYAKAGRWRDLFTMTRRADRYFPDHELTRGLHDETTHLLEHLLLGEGEKLSAVQALALFFDFKELAPVGRRGDEIVRRLADRLIELDLLDQAADLLQYQVDKRLTGAARATIAARLATIRLMNGKPLMALTALHDTRLSDLPDEVRQLRLLLEARAQSDLSRTDLALELTEGEAGLDFARLRAGILWSARRWRDAGEAAEALVGTRWSGSEPLGDRDRSDIVRASIAYAVGDDRLALDRLRQKFSAKMMDSPAAKTFAFLMRPGAALTREFRTIVQDANRGDGLKEFLADWRSRHPDTPLERSGATPGDDADQPVAPPGPHAEHAPLPTSG